MLPNFLYNTREENKNKDRSTVSIPMEIASLKPITEYILKEAKFSNIVYERLYPNSLPTTQRKSLFFTEISSINPLSEVYFGRTFFDGEMENYYRIKSKNDKTLIFESRFESGNLKFCIKKNDNEYDLFVQNDINTYGNTQWFFFKVSNTRKGHKVFFNIKNFVNS